MLDTDCKITYAQEYEMDYGNYCTTTNLLYSCENIPATLLYA